MASAKGVTVCSLADLVSPGPLGTPPAQSHQGAGVLPGLSAAMTPAPTGVALISISPARTWRHPRSLVFRRLLVPRLGSSPC